MNASAQLAAWVARERLSINVAASRLGVAWGALRDWIAGVGRPGLDAAIRVQRVAGVPVDAWYLGTKHGAMPKATKRRAAKRAA